MTMTTENLIHLVHSKPEVWDQHHVNYSSKDLKLKAWDYIGEKMNCSANQAKVRWTNLRDLFRRQLKKALKMAKMTGDPESYVPRWRHFRDLLFLKDQIIKNDAEDFPFDDSMFHYPQTIMENEDSKSELDYYAEYPQNSGNNSLTVAVNKRHPEIVGNSFEHSDRPKKRQRLEELNYADASEDYPSFSSSVHNETDENYHFLMSILPSLRRIQPNRKTSFKMKVLQLIMDEESCMQG